MTTTSVPIQTDFEPLRPFLVGNPKQFLVYQGRVRCVRAHPDDLARKNKELNPCAGCPHFGQGCEIEAEEPVEAAYVNKQDGSVSGMEPSVRRGIGIETRPFLVLRFKPGLSHASMPRELWDNTHADKAMDEANLHYLLTDPRTAKFHTLKGQLRFYGSEGEFAASPYADYLDVFDRFAPAHHPISMDKSAIEPRVCTVVTKEPLWLQVFQGTPKVIAREIELSSLPNQEPAYLYRAYGRTFCYLEGELDKEEYSRQCASCPIASLCKVKVDHLERVAGDWHGLNATGFFGDLYDKCTDPYLKKDLRGQSKIGGLASLYGGSKYTLSRALNMAEDAADAVLSRFFAKFATARRFMDSIKRGLQQHGSVRNLFNRRRDMRRWTQSMATMDDPLGGPPIADLKQRRKDFGFAVRTGLNYPIQGTAGELMKMAMIEIVRLIRANNWNPLSGLTMPRSLPVGNESYKSLIFAMLSTVHDELLDVIKAGTTDIVIPRAYRAMQLKPVMDSLGAGFPLELDVEYDRYGAWTAGIKVHTARIKLLNRLADSGGDLRPNVAVVQLKDCSPEFIAGCNRPEAMADPDLQLAVQDGDQLRLPPGGPFNLGYIRKLAQVNGLSVTLAIM